MRFARGLASLGLAVGLILPTLAHAEVFETSVGPGKGEKFRSADFRLWLPDGVRQVRAVIVRQHGCGRNGIDHADDVQWQALARKWDAGLLGSHFQETKECDDWADPAQGSERALLAALAAFARKSGHAELTRTPWVLWGHSGGALWSLRLAVRDPSRVIAVFARSGALRGEAGGVEKITGVPVLFNFGAREKTGKFAAIAEGVAANFTAGRARGAPWAVAIDPLAEHECRDSRKLAVPFLNTMLERRLPAASSASAELRPLATGGAWLGNPQSLDIAPQEQFAGEKAKANWLPDEAAARRWQEFCKTGSVTDPTPPPAPTNVKAVVMGDEVRLTWSAVADLQSGIKLFHIYRDGERIGTVGGRVTPANKDGAYQAWNYGDEPEPRPGSMRFTDRAGTRGSQYQVTTVNHADLESGRSLPAVAAGS